MHDASRSERRSDRGATTTVDPRRPADVRPDLFLPDPEPRDIFCTVISVDDHLVEPPDLFEGRVPHRMADRAPKVLVDADGSEFWEFDGARYTQTGLNAMAGRRKDTFVREPSKFEEMRPGCYDIHARIRDMDINGVWASLSFPSQIAGFCGRTFSACTDAELGLAVMRAWNDWVFEEWYSPYPDRIIPLGITWLADPELGAEEIRRNAERGFRSVSLPERPQYIGLPNLFSGHWDPIVRACEETDTVISLHVGSSGSYPTPDGAPHPHLNASLFGQLSLCAAAEWVWSGLAARYPGVKVAMSEGGIGWVAMLLDRLENLADRAGYQMPAWDLRPAELLLRNFWFCTIDDPSTIVTRDRIGVEKIMVEVDYPHADSTWPDTQPTIERAWGGLSSYELHRMCHANAAELYRHPLPEPCRDGHVERQA